MTDAADATTMTRRLATGLLLVTLMGLLVGVAGAARSESVEVRDRSGRLGLLSITVMDDGSAYIAPDHLAALLKGAWSVKGDRGILTVNQRTVEFVRGQPRATVQGEAIALDAAARVVGTSWLVSRDFLGKGLPRLVPGVSIAAPTEPRKPVAKPVQEVRLEEVGDAAVLRVLLEGAAGEIKHTVLQDPYRLVIDVYRPKESTGGGEPGRGGMQPLRLIVLDAGHGGHDSGAMGPSGVMEKDVVLDVTRRVARMIEPGLGVKVVMSRDSDVFVPLRERTNFANKQGADLFVSIHANAHPQAVSEGVETYFLSSEASDNAALAWMDTNRSAPCLLAKLVRSRSGTNTSLSRLITTFTPRPGSIMRATRRVTSSTTSFSMTPLGPMAPESWPPWPASSTISRSGCMPPRPGSPPPVDSFGR